MALLIGFTNNDFYKPYDDISTEQDIYNLNGEKKYQDAINLSSKFLRTNPLSVKTIFERSYSYHKLANDDSAQFYMIQGRRILNAMSFSGDGKTKETAIFSLSPTGGQDYIYKVLSSKIGTMGSGSDKNGNFLDILEVLPRDGSTPYKLYFIIQHATNKMFSEKK